MSEPNPDEFIDLYADFQPILLRLLRRHVPTADHEAAAAEAFRALWHHPAENDPRAWLARLGLSAARLPCRGGPEHRHILVVFFDALSHLPRGLAVTMLLRYLDGRTPHQIAVARGLTHAAVDRQLDRARRILTAIR